MKLRQTFCWALLSALVLVVPSTLSAATGDRESTAKGISFSTRASVVTGSLVDEYDTDGTTGYGVYYLKFTAKRGTAYTFWTTTAGTNDISVDAEYDMEKYSAPSFSIGAEQYDSANYRGVIAASDWTIDTEDSNNSDSTGFTYYIVLSGNIGAKFALHYQLGEIAEEIDTVTPVENRDSTLTGAIANGDHYVAANLIAGRKYYFGVIDGTTNVTSVSVSLPAGSEGMLDPVVTELSTNNPTYTDGSHVGISVVPQSTGTHILELMSYDATAFTLTYRLVGARAIGQHPVTGLEIPSESVTASPAERNDKASGYFDSIIDNQLFSMSLTNNVLYRFEVTGVQASGTATNLPLVMEIYDAKGNTLLRNDNGCNVYPLLSFKPAATGTYYLGLCQDIEDEDADSPVTNVTATFSVSLPAEGDYTNSFDQADAEGYDEYGDANLGVAELSPRPALESETPLQGDPDGTGTNLFCMADWSDIFAFSGRKGITYSLALTSDSCSTFTGIVYTVSGTRETVVATNADFVNNAITFTPAASQKYYLRVGMADAQGSDAAYVIHAIGYAAGETNLALGELTVQLEGPETGATWSLSGESTKYSSGDTVLLPFGTNVVTFSTVTGWTKPADASIVIDSPALTVIEGDYSDTFDPKDDVSSAATAITPGALKYNAVSNEWAGSTSFSRSLWSSDPADWFTFTVSADGLNWYAFEAMANSSDSDPRLTLFDSTATNELSLDGIEAGIYLPKGKYYLRVDQTNAFSGCYTLDAGLLDYGTVQFGAATYSFNKGTPSAVVQVKRTGSAPIAVSYTTVSNTAVANQDYRPVSGYLTWAQGDKSTKVITIPLIPQLYNVWEGNKTFSVMLALTNETVTANSFPLLGAVSNTVVTIKETSSQVPGTLGFSGYGEEDTAFSVPKKPVLTANYGDDVTLWIGRTVGHNGRVGVKVETVKGTATTNDFVYASTNLYWEADDTNDQAFTFSTRLADSYQADKTMTVKLTVDTTAGARATLGVTPVTVTLRDPSVISRLEESAFAKTIRGTKGVWYFDDSYLLRSTALAKGKTETLSFTLVGPGRLAITPALVGGDGSNDLLTATIGREKFVCTNDAEIVRYLGKGSQTVSFTVTHGSNSTADGDVYATFALYSTYNEDTDTATDMIYDWTSLAVATLVAPAAKDVVVAGHALEWDADNSADVYYRLYIDTVAKNLGTTNALVYEPFVTGLEYLPAATNFVAGLTYNWRVDSVMLDSEGNVALIATNTASWTFTVQATNAIATALVTASGEPVDVSDGISLVQGVACTYYIGNTNGETNATYKLASGKLPDGLKFAQDRASGRWVISGVPTKTNSAVASFQVIANRVNGTMLDLAFTVEPIRLASGTFNGILAIDGTTNVLSTNLNQNIASAMFTATDAGRLTAKIQVGTKSFSFSGNGYTTNLTEGTDGQPVLGTTLTSVTVFNRVSYTNTLDLTVCRSDGATNDCWVTKLGLPTDAKLTLNLLTPDNKGIETNLVYTGSLYRNNSADVQGLAALAPWTGYYTVSLPSEDTALDAPAGAGYLTLTLDAKGGAKLTGVLADGTAWSASATAAYIGGDCAATDQLLIPVFTAKNKEVFGGWLVLAHETDANYATVTVVSPDSAFKWCNADSNSTYEGTDGFEMEITPTGGYYDKLFNLQRYYLDMLWTVNDMTLNEFPDELFSNYGTNYSEIVATPSDLELTLIGNTVTIAKKSLVKRSDNAKLYDWEASTNAANLTVNYARATGIFTGSFSLWLGDDVSGDETAQKEVTSLKYQGVLTPVKAGGDVYESNPGMGFFLLPVKVATPKSRTWTGSYPFLLKADYQAPTEEGWTYQEAPAAPSVTIDGTTIPATWFIKNGLASSGASAATLKVAATHTWANDLTAIESFIAGLTPTNALSRFIAKIAYSNGMPLVTWSPDLGDERVYTIYGKADMEDDEEWTTPTNSDSHFFKVKVTMPNS